jgi:hypothetical protein
VADNLEADRASSRSFHADSGGGTQQLHVELGFGKSAVIILWFCAVICSAALIGLFVAYHAYNQTSAHVNVLQYDLAQIRAQLIDKGFYEPTGH